MLKPYKVLRRKSRLILISALTVSTLISVPRILISIHRPEIAEQLGLSLGDTTLRFAVVFCFAWLVLSFNLLWKRKFQNQPIRNITTTDIAINIVILLIGATVLTISRQIYSPEFLDKRELFFSSLISYFIIQLNLLLIARVVNLNLEYQKDIFEKEQIKQRALQHQLQALRTQVNPHFLFNALNSLNALIRQKSDNALTFVDKLSYLLRSTLQQSDEDFITLKDELDYLDAYIFLQKERFGEKFEVRINIPQDWQTQMIPSFSLQLLIENSIKHNVISKRQPLEVEVYQEDHFLVVKNPIQIRKDNIESTGTGLGNLSTRFSLLKKRKIEIINDGEYFIVKLPILE